jgi:hypothetical protein
MSSPSISQAQAILTPDSNQLVESWGNLSLFHIGKQDILKGMFSKSVFGVYRDTYQERYGWVAGDSDYREIYEDDLRYMPSAMFLGVCIDDILVGTVRVIRKNRDAAILLPIEKEFGLNTHLLMESLDIDEIWHGGRISINKQTLNLLGFPRSISVKILKMLLRYGFAPLMENENNVMLVENDETFQKISGVLGIRWDILGPSRDWLGSPTYPAMIRASQLAGIPWLQAGAPY